MGSTGCSRFMHFFTPIFKDKKFAQTPKLSARCKPMSGRIAAWIIVVHEHHLDQVGRWRCQRKKGIDSTTVVSRYTRIPNFTAGTSGA